MNILPSEVSDIDEIFRLYALATEHQRAINAVVVWPNFERELVVCEIAENRQWKLLIDEQIACVWATTFSDPQIWEERNVDKAIYIHRIATNPVFRGRNFVLNIVQWARKYAEDAGLDYVRLDTLGHNYKLIDYYQQAGFTFLGMFDLKDTSELTAHYQGVPAALFEIKI